MTDHYAVTHACSILITEDAKRRGVETNSRALAETHEALRNLSDKDKGQVIEAANRLLDLLGGSR